MNENLKIRFTKPKDIARIVELCGEHSEFEKKEFNSGGKATKLGKALFCENPKLFCILSEMNDETVGFATYMKQFSTWEAEDYVYMDCLYLIESARNMGIGEILMHSINQHSQALGCKLIQWQTPVFNKRAIKFYKQIGAYSKTKERFFW